MKCSTCGKPLKTTDRRRKYCSDKCRANRAKKREMPNRGISVPGQPRRLSVDVAAVDGTDLELLMAMRDRVASAVANPDCPPRDLASLTRRLDEIRKQIVAERVRLAEEGGDVGQVEDGEFDPSAV